MDIYIGNLPFSYQETQITELLKQFGEASSVRLMTDRETGRSRGFAFASYANDAEGRTAIAQLNGKEVDGRRLVVNEAQARSGGGRGGPGGGRDRDEGGYGGSRRRY